MGRQYECTRESTAGKEDLSTKKLVRIDPGTNEAIAEIPTEENIPEGGAASVTVGDGPCGSRASQ